MAVILTSLITTAKNEEQKMSNFCYTIACKILVR